MAAFSEDPDEWQRLDWRLLQNSPITLYQRPAILEEDSAWLNAHGYNVITLDAQWPDLTAFHRDVAVRLRFPAYYGHNLNAFNDCVSDLPIPDDGGVVLELRRFDTFSQRFPREAHAILDILAANARRFLLRGRRLIILVQTADGRAHFDDVGAQPVVWNPREWLDANRDLGPEQPG